MFLWSLGLAIFYWFLSLSFFLYPFHIHFGPTLDTTNAGNSLLMWEGFMGQIVQKCWVYENVVFVCAANRCVFGSRVERPERILVLPLNMLLYASLDLWDRLSRNSLLSGLCTWSCGDGGVWLHWIGICDCLKYCLVSSISVLCYEWHVGQCVLAFRFFWKLG